MTILGLHGIDARANAANIGKDLIEFLQPVIALEHDHIGPVPNQHAIKQIERAVGHRMRVGIGEEGTGQKILVNGDTARDMHFLDDAGGQVVQERMRVKSMIVRIQVEVFDVKKQTGAGLAADQIEKLDIGHPGFRPFEQIADVLEQKWHRDARLNRADFGDDRLRDLLGLRQRQQIGEIAASMREFGFLCGRS